MLESNKDRMMWGILAIVVAVAIGAVALFGFETVMDSVIGLFTDQIDSGFTPVAPQ